MPMFEELYALALGACLTMTVSADEKTGRMTVNVIPKPRKEVDESTLTQPLSLTATPQEFDTGFIDALRGYRTAHQSLAQQAEATKEVIEAARAASVRKASDATSKASKAASTSANTSSRALTSTPASSVSKSNAAPSRDAQQALVGDEPDEPADGEDDHTQMATGTAKGAAGGTGGDGAPVDGQSYDLFG